jgi:hypothetical protein
VRKEEDIGKGQRERGGYRGRVKECARKRECRGEGGRVRERGRKT